MKSFCIKEYEQSLWEKSLFIETKKLKKLEEGNKNDPTSNLIDIHIEFNDMLKSGKDRTSKKFMDKVSDLAKREKVEKNRSKTFDIIKEIDKECEQRLLVSEITRKLANIKFYKGR